MKLKHVLLVGVAASDKCAKMVKECKSTKDGITTYHGVNLSKTSSGKMCRDWKEIEYIRDDLAGVDDDDIKNYCRNPKLTGLDDVKEPWCFIDWKKEGLSTLQAILSNNPLFESCDMTMVPDCDEVADFCLKNYRGTTDTTRCGHKCKCWSSVVLSDRPSDIWPGASDNHNYCRTLPFNGKEETHPWCYIDDPKADKNWDYCDPDFTVEKCAAPMGEDVVEKEGSGNNNEGSGDDAVVDECIWFDFESHRDFTP